MSFYSNLDLGQAEFLWVGSGRVPCTLGTMFTESGLKGTRYKVPERYEVLVVYQVLGALLHIFSCADNPISRNMNISRL